MRLLCFSSFRGKRSLSLSLCHRLRCLALRFSLPPSSLLLSLSRVTSAPGIPRLRRYERQRRKSERASWAAKRRGVVNDSSEPRSAFLPRALSLLPAPPHPSPPPSRLVLRYFLSLRLCGPALSPPENAFRDLKPRENARACVRSLVYFYWRPSESMSYDGRRNFFGLRRVYALLDRFNRLFAKRIIRIHILFYFVILFSI